MANKLYRTAGAPEVPPTETENVVIQALQDLESNVADMSAELRALQISSAKEVEVKGGKKAVLIFVPVPQLAAYRKIQQRLVRELEKKFSDKSVLIIAQRRILSKPGRRSSRSKQPRPRSRTLTAVHDSILEDLVYPSEIVGKRYHQAVDGSKLVKVFIDAKDATSVEHKVASFASSYKALTGKDVTIEFKAADL
ncbi:unnamed protein product [Jaminaea pallidilutea]